MSMATFKNTQWDVNETGDALCEKLFKKTAKEKKNKLKKKVKKTKSVIKQFKTDIERSLEKKLEHDDNIKLIYSPQYTALKNNDKQFAMKKHKKLQNGESSKKSKKKKKIKTNFENNDKRLKYDEEKNALNEFKHSDIEEDRDKKVKLMLELLKQKVANEKLAKKSSNISTPQKYQEQDGGTSKQIYKTKKKKHQTNNESMTENLLISKKNIPLKVQKKQQFFEKLKKSLEEVEKVKKPVLTLRQKMMEKLRAARFRFLNEQIYTTNSKEAQKIFQSDPEAFKAYHEGYRQQVDRWPMNPLDYVIKSIRKMPKFYVVADFGCGEAKLAKSVEQNVYSFDLVAVNASVIACDMTKVPLEDSSVDVAVFCLSLMGTNLNDYIVEANRILKVGGTLKIAEVESRFEDIDNFVKGLQQFGFRNVWRDLSHNLFYFLDFTKVTNVKNKKKLPTLSLLPCLYKKR